jgi:beta-phosphoglucomutase-like phosphatase (HAD superfamily)
VGRVIATCWSVTQEHCLGLTQSSSTHDTLRSSSVIYQTRHTTKLISRLPQSKPVRQPQPTARATAGGAHSSRQCSCAKHLPILRPFLRQQQPPPQACCALLTKSTMQPRIHLQLASADAPTTAATQEATSGLLCVADKVDHAAHVVQQVVQPQPHGAQLAAQALRGASQGCIGQQGVAVDLCVVVVVVVQCGWWWSAGKDRQR